MTWLPAFVVVVPFIVAGALIAVMERVDRKVAEIASLLACIVVFGGCCVLFESAALEGTTVIWFGGWHPGNVVGLGIAFAVDLAAAAVAALIALLVTMTVLFSREYFDEVGTIFYILLLAMLGSMIAFAFAADAFDMFVFYEVFSISAYALSAYRIETEGAFEGALQFALTNTLAGLFVLLGIILLEGRTGELNLAAIGHSLASRHETNALTAVSFALVSIGLFTRGALAPLHFWFDEVHANAPTPLCAILTGAMGPLALYGFMRFYWGTYSAALAPGPLLALPFLAIGLLSTIVGCMMCLRETNLKRALAFSTVAHAGAALVGLQSFDAMSLAATALYLVSYAFGAAGLFMAIAILRRRASSVVVDRLEGAGRDMPLTSVVFALGAVALTVWPVWHEIATPGSESTFANAVFVCVDCVTGGAFAAVWFRIFVLRAAHAPGPRPSVPWFMLAPALVLVCAPIAIASIPVASAVAIAAARGVVDRGAYEATILSAASHVAPLGTSMPVAAPAIAFALTGTVVVAAFLLGVSPVLRAARRRLASLKAVEFVRSLHCGDIGLYLGFMVAIAAATAFSLIRL